MVCHSGPKLTTLVLKNVQDQSGIATVVRLPLWSSHTGAAGRPTGEAHHPADFSENSATAIRFLSLIIFSTSLDAFFILFL